MPLLPVVLAHGERAVCHLVDPVLPAGGLIDQLAFYFDSEKAPIGELYWIGSAGHRQLDLQRAIGDQVPADALIEARS